MPNPNVTKIMTIGVAVAAVVTEGIAVTGATVVIAVAEVAVAEVVEAVVNEATAGEIEVTEEIEKIMIIIQNLHKVYLCLIFLKKKFPVELLVQPKMIKKGQKLIKTNETMNGILIKMT